MATTNKTGTAGQAAALPASNIYKFDSASRMAVVVACMHLLAARFAWLAHTTSPALPFVVTALLRGEANA